MVVQKLRESNRNNTAHTRSTQHFAVVKIRTSPYQAELTKLYLHSGNKIRRLHVLSSCYFTSMQDSYYLNNVIKFVFSKQIRSAPADIKLTWAQMMNEMESAKRKIVETMTSTERCGPRLCNEGATQ